MTYVQLLVAAALGWAWFGDAPDLVTYLGAALIIGGGLLLWRSQKPREVADAPTRANLPR
jgi:drug/metabolite transporter (DMT)-like permease